VTAAEFYLLVETNVFVEQRVELVDGEIVPVERTDNFHCIALDETARLLRIGLGETFWVRMQATLDLNEFSVVDPDIAVVPATAKQSRVNPTTALLIVEVSETTLSYDRNRKASLYAAADIADYWIIDLVNMRLEVRRDPAPDATADFGASYTTLTTHTVTDTVSPLILPMLVIQVVDLFP